MSLPSKTPFESIMTPVSRMSFAVALCAFAAAGIGWIVNNWLSGWMAVGGMFGVGLFYLGVGVLNLKLLPTQSDDHSPESFSHRAAEATNLVGEPVSRPRLFTSDDTSSDAGSQQQSDSQHNATGISSQR